MNYVLASLACLFISLAPLNIAVAANDPSDGLWNYRTCKGPSYGRTVFRNRVTAYTTLLFDISSDGRVGNIRIKASKPEGLLDRHVIKAISRWRYFAYYQGGVDVPRTNVEVTFRYGLEPEDFPGATCLQTPWPKQTSVISGGDPLDPVTQLKQCHSLSIPNKAARDRISGKVGLTYDISAEGLVSNIREPDNLTSIFSARAKKSLSRWQYWPFVENATPISRSNMKVDMYFGELPEDALDHNCLYANWESNATTQIMLIKRKRILGLSPLARVKATRSN